MHTLKYMHTCVHKYNSNYAITQRVIEFLTGYNKKMRYILTFLQDKIQKVSI